MDDMTEIGRRIKEIEQEMQARATRWAPQEEKWGIEPVFQAGQSDTIDEQIKGVMATHEVRRHSEKRLPTADGPVDEDSIEKLTDWIDYPPPFPQRPKTSPVYLFKPEFTFPVLMEGLIYAVGKYKILSSEFHTLCHIATYQWEQDLTGWMEQYGLAEGPGKICLKEQIESDEWEDKVRDACLTSADKFSLPKTIVAFARLARKLEISNYDMRIGIGALQGDIEGVFDEEEEEDEE